MGFYLSGGHIETLNAAAEVLKSGGNAFDAAIAAYVASFVAEPAMSSAGGGGFAICSQRNKNPIAIDFFSGTPVHKPADQNIQIKPVEVHFGDEIETYYAGVGTIAIPGAIRGVFLMHRNFGTMPLNELFHHAIKLARDGIEFNDFQNLDIHLLKNIFELSSIGREIFFDNNHKVKPVGSIIKIPELADFLEVLAIEGEDLFYRGEVGAQLVADCATHGGVIDMESLAGFQAKMVRALHGEYMDHHIYTMGHPSMGGPLLIYTMQEMAKKSWSDEFRSRTYFQQLADVLIEANKLQDNHTELFQILGLKYPAGDNRRGATSHFNVVDKDDNAVSLTMTIGEGCGYFIPGTGIHMNNMLGEPGLLPNGINSWTPASRMRSMMAPVIVTDQMKNPTLLLGSGGAVRIPYMLAQVMHHIFISDCHLQEAIDWPRLHFDGGVLHIEASDRFNKVADIPLHHWEDRSLYFGGVHAVWRESWKSSFEAYGDRRRDGVELIG